MAAIIDDRCGGRGAGRAATARFARRSAIAANVIGGGAAAAADDADAVALHELRDRIRQRLGLLGEDRLAVRALDRQASVGDARHRARAVLAEEADRVAHVLGAGRAVQPDHVDPQRLQRAQHRGDVGPQQHLAAVGQQRHGGVDRQRAPGALESGARAEHGGLDLEDVLRRLDDDEVRAAVDQPLGLLGEDLDQLAEADLPERRIFGCRQVARRADRARHEAALAGGFARELGGLRVDLHRVVGQAPLAELDPRGLEGVGLEHFGARLEHRGVHALDHVGPVEYESLVALALQAAVVLRRQVELLERGAHAAVVDDDMLGDRLEIVAL